MMEQVDATKQTGGKNVGGRPRRKDGRSRDPLYTFRAPDELSALVDRYCRDAGSGYTRSKSIRELIEEGLRSAGYLNEVRLHD